MKNSIFRDKTPYSLLSHVSEEIVASVIRVEKQETSIKEAEELKKEAACCSETSVDFHQTAWRYIAEDRTLHNHR
jgi:hypothetical protein